MNSLVDKSNSKKKDNGHSMRNFLGRFCIQLAGIALAIAFWWIGSSFLSKDFHGFTPMKTFSALVEMVPTKPFLVGLVESMKRLLGGMGIAIGIGIPIGILVGYIRIANKLTYTLFQFLRMTSPLSWMPIAIIIFGVGAGPVYFLIAISAVWPIVIDTAHGVEKVNQGWIDVAKTLGGKGLTLIRRVILPAIMPDILTGLRLALGVSWIVIVPAEMLGVASGLGYMILDFRDIVDYASVMSVILVIGTLGYVTDAIIKRLMRIFSWES
jgi:NitT/TauT family transport system permease protein